MVHLYVGHVVVLICGGGNVFLFHTRSDDNFSVNEAGFTERSCCFKRGHASSYHPGFGTLSKTRRYIFRIKRVYPLSKIVTCMVGSGQPHANAASSRDFFKT
jgi:hypothetical protein